MKIRRGLSALVGGLLSFSVVLGTSAYAGSTGTFDARNISVILTADHSRYRAGDCPSLQIRLRNNGAAQVTIIGSSPWSASALVITDSTGNRVVASSAASTEDYMSNRPTLVLSPGKSVLLTWKGSSWFSISEWGFFLSKPGVYSISAIPTVSGNYMKPDLKTIRSNKLRVEIAP